MLRPADASSALAIDSSSRVSGPPPHAGNRSVVRRAGAVGRAATAAVILGLAGLAAVPAPAAGRPGSTATTTATVAAEPSRLAVDVAGGLGAGQARGLAGLPDLQREIELLVESAALASATVGVSVVDADSGAVLCRLNEGEPLIPASNMKLLTTGAALHVLGSDFAFRTRLVHDAARERLIVIGSGDPGLGHPTLLADTRIGDVQGVDVETLIGTWINAVRAAGITRLSEVVVDDRVVDRSFIHPSWPRDQLHFRYCAPVAGLNFHANVLSFFPRPVPGERAVAGRSVPRADWIAISSRASSDPRKRSTVRIERDLASGMLQLAGNVPKPIGIPINVTLADPPGFFARLMADRLRAAGVRVDAARVAANGDPLPDGLPTIGPVVTTRLETLLGLANTDSDNLVAEALFRRIAVARGEMPATFEGGAAVIREAVRDRLDRIREESRLRVADGSGLSRGNMVPAALMTAWLRDFHLDSELGPLLRGSLAVAGRTGTLRRRLKSLPAGVTVRAKSGTINQVSGLSGYVVDGQRTLVFSILINGNASSSPARALQDRIVMRLAEALAESRSMATGRAG